MRSLVGWFLVLAVLFAGCVQPEDAPEVSWVPPEGLRAGVAAPVRWTVEGAEGEASHAALHVGRSAVASPDAASYTFHYASTNRSAGGAFETAAVFPGPGTWYARPHVVVGGQEVWGRERTLLVGEGVAVSVTAPRFARSGEPIELVVEIAGAGSEDVTDLVVLAAGEAPNGTAANREATSAATRENGTWRVPFAAPLGWGAFHVHARTAERTFASGPFEVTGVALSVRLIDPPAEVPAGESLEFAWEVMGAPVVLTTHTGLHYGPEPWVRLGGSVLAVRHEGEAAPVAVPGSFVASHTFADPGTVHVRAHLRLGSGTGVLDILSDSHALRVT